MAMQHGGHFAQINGAAPVDAHVQRQRMLAQLNETTWQRIGENSHRAWHSETDKHT